MVGREAFASEAATDKAADLASADVMTLNQEAFVASRFVYVEGSQEQVDRFSEKLQRRIAERAAASGDIRPLAMDLREQIEALMMIDDEFRVWGKTDGRGLVVRSEESVDFPTFNKTVNVARVISLDAAVQGGNAGTDEVRG